MKACCDDFAKYSGEVQSRSPLSIAYAAAGTGIDAQFEQGDDGLWNVNGCCGGGCYVVEGMKFCPFCGASLARTR